MATCGKENGNKIFLFGPVLGRGVQLMTTFETTQVI